MLLNNEVNKKDIESVKAVKILLAGVLYEQNLHSAIKLHRNICSIFRKIQQQHHLWFNKVKFLF